MKALLYLDNSGRPIDAVEKICQWVNNDHRVDGILNKKKKLMVAIEPQKDKRTNAANSYYWGVLIKAFMREWPDLSKLEIHMILKERFLLDRKSQAIIQKEIESGIHRSDWYIRSSSELSVYEFWLFCEQCTQALFEIGGYLDEEEGKIYAEAKEINNKAGSGL